MKFRVLKGQYSPQAKGLYLHEDNWDDWFTYTTTYFLRYVDAGGNCRDIGSVKVGQHQLEGGKDGQRRPEIPSVFETLDERFFSIGQSEDYYENIKKLGDVNRAFILVALRDMAYDPDLYEAFKDENVTKVSLMRDVTEKTLLGQFKRMAHGGVRLTRYSFGYSFPAMVRENGMDIPIDKPATITFDVQPESNPPTNIHIVIGRNGVGKTFLIKNLLGAVTKSKTSETDGYFFDFDFDLQCKISASDLFANVICVGFSAFDDLSASFEQSDGKSFPYVFIGLDNSAEKTAASRLDKLSEQFADSLYKSFSSTSKKALWHKAVDVLSYDNYLQEAGICEIKYSKEKALFKEEAKDRFAPLSAGHKIILLVITRLVGVVEEKSLIILDEPEMHLHPPLLAAFIRALSDILTAKNGVAIIATHSPVVLQEVPSSCVWKMQRSRNEVSLERLQQETFGTNINALIREVFGLEVEKSGFHQLLTESLKKHDYRVEAVASNFNDELGDEAKAILRILAALNTKRLEGMEESCAE